MNDKIQKAYKELRNYAFYLNKYSVDEAEDLLQDTMLTMLEKMDMYKEHAGRSLTAWGSTIMHNLYINKIRLNKNFVPVEMLNNLPEKEELKDRKEIQSKIKEVQSSINDKRYHDIFVLRKFSLSYQEIADHLGIPMNTAKCRFHLMKLSVCEK